MLKTRLTQIKTVLNIYIWNTVTHQTMINDVVTKEIDFIFNFKRYPEFYQYLLDLKQSVKESVEAIDTGKGKRRAYDDQPGERSFKRTATSKA